MKTQRRSWWQKRRKLLISSTGIALLVGVFLFILMGYEFHWNWTGFETKTLWDWLNLLGVLAIPVVAGLGVAWFTRTQQLRDQEHEKLQRERDQDAARIQHDRDQQVADQRAELEREKALDDQREAALQEYINKISELLEKQLRTSPPEEDMRIVARARTLNILRRLNSERKGNVIQFLYESHLLSTRIIDLSYTQLSEANLYRARLCNANLFKTGLFRANLFHADLTFANLSETYLVKADLRGAKLCYADLRGANLNEADLRGADLREAMLYGVKLQGALYNGKKIQMRDPQGEELLSLEPTHFDGLNCEEEGMAYVDCYGWDKPEECQPEEDQSSTPDTERMIDLSYIDLSYIDLAWFK